MHSPWQFWEPHPPRIKRMIELLCRGVAGARVSLCHIRPRPERSNLIEKRMIKPAWKFMHIQACGDSVLDC